MAREHGILWNSLAELASLYRSESASDILRSVVLDVLLFVIVDVGAKTAIGDPARAGNSRKRAVWLAESVFLFAVCLVLHFFHHTPVLLFVTAGATLSFGVPLRINKSGNLGDDGQARAQRISWCESDDEDDQTSKATKGDKSLEPHGGTLRRPPLPGLKSLWRFRTDLNTAPGNQQTPGGSSSGLCVSGSASRTSPQRNPRQPLLRSLSIGGRLKGISQGLGSFLCRAGDECRGVLSGSDGHAADSYSLPFGPSYSLRSALLPPGLPNGGRNLCFINCVLQCLSHTPGLAAHLADMRASVKLPPQDMPFLSSLAMIMTSCRLDSNTPKTRVVSTVDFRAASATRCPLLIAPPAKPQLQEQHDAAEFLLWLLDAMQSISLRPEKRQEQEGIALQEECDRLAELVAKASTGRHVSDSTECLSTAALKKLSELCRKAMNVGGTRENAFFAAVIQLMAEAEWVLHQRTHCSFVQSVFECQQIAARHCLNCSRVSVTLEPVRMLHLTIPRTMTQTVRLDECFRRFQEVEEMAGQNRLRCNCSSRLSSSTSTSDPPPPVDGLRPGQCRTLMRKLPPCLIVQLLRFEYSQRLGKTLKVSTPVDFPLTSLNLRSTLFEEAVCLPSPCDDPVVYDLYAMAVHVGDSDPSFGHYYSYCLESNGLWYMFNDNIVTEVGNMQRECQELFVRQNVYLLFYRQLT